MSLAAIRQQTKTVTVGKGLDVTVRGLNADDFLALSEVWADVIAMLFGGIDLKKEDQAGMAVLAKYPAFAYKAIALAANEPEGDAQVKLLPITKQIELAQAVYELTIPEGIKPTAKKLKPALRLLNRS